MTRTVELLGAGALISMPPPGGKNQNLWSNIEDFAQSQMGEWLTERAAVFQVLVTPIDDKRYDIRQTVFDYYLFIHGRVIAIQFLVQFGGADHHLEWWDDPVDPMSDSEIPGGWIAPR